LQEPFVNIPEDTIRDALKVVLGIMIHMLNLLLYYWLESIEFYLYRIQSLNGFSFLLQMFITTRYWFTAKEER